MDLAIPVVNAYFDVIGRHLCLIDHAGYSHLAFQSPLKAPPVLSSTCNSTGLTVVGFAGDLELNVLTEMDVRHTSALYVLTSEIVQLRSNISPIVNLVNALRDHKSEPIITPGLSGRPGKVSTSSVTISPMRYGNSFLLKLLWSLCALQDPQILLLTLRYDI